MDIFVGFGGKIVPGGREVGNRKQTNIKENKQTKTKRKKETCAVKCLVSLMAIKVYTIIPGHNKIY